MRSRSEVLRRTDKGMERTRKTGVEFGLPTTILLHHCVPNQRLDSKLGTDFGLHCLQE